MFHRKTESATHCAQHFRGWFLLAAFNFGEVLLGHADLCGDILETPVLVPARVPKHPTVELAHQRLLPRLLGSARHQRESALRFHTSGVFQTTFPDEAAFTDSGQPVGSVNSRRNLQPALEILSLTPNRGQARTARRCR